MSKTDIVVKASLLITGACVGFMTAVHFLDKKYKNLVDERIQACQETYEETIEDLKKQLELKNKNEKAEPDDHVENAPPTHLPDGYSKYTRAYATESETEPDEITEYDGPVVISPEEFGEMEGYSEQTLILYADGILADEDDAVIDDIDCVIGADSLAHMGEYEDDAVHVRNPHHKCDYEILKDPRNFRDI